MTIDDDLTLRSSVAPVFPGATLDPLRSPLLGEARDAISPGELRAWNRPQPPIATPVQSPSAAIATGVASRNAALPDALTLARLSADVYADVPSPPTGWHAATDAELARIGVTPAELVSPISGFRARVYAQGSGADARIVMAFRGASTADDWVASGAQALGLQTDQYRRALDLGNRVALAGADTVVFTGHSLGGGLAATAALAAGHAAATFNAAGLSAATIERSVAARQSTGGSVPDIRAYYIRGEALSAFQDGGDRVAGAILGYLLGGMVGAAGGARSDAPEAYGTRIALDPTPPTQTPWFADTPAARHGIDRIISGLGGR